MIEIDIFIKIQKKMLLMERELLSEILAYVQKEYSSCNRKEIIRPIFRALSECMGNCGLRNAFTLTIFPDGIYRLDVFPMLEGDVVTMDSIIDLAQLLFGYLQENLWSEEINRLLVKYKIQLVFRKNDGCYRVYIRE